MPLFIVVEVLLKPVFMAIAGFGEGCRTKDRVIFDRFDKPAVAPRKLIHDLNDKSIGRGLRADLQQLVDKRFFIEARVKLREHAERDGG
jgi:hypothetical protein